jgi:hypothetical protein
MGQRIEKTSRTSHFVYIVLFYTCRRIAGFTVLPGSAQGSRRSLRAPHCFVRAGIRVGVIVSYL